MKPGVPRQGIKAVGQRIDMAGLSAGNSEGGFQLGLGWSSYQRVDVVDQNTQLCLAWPSGSFYQARVGSEFPPDMKGCGSEKGENR